MASNFDWSPYAVGGAQRSDSFSGMQPDFSDALARMFETAPAEIRANLRVGSGFRSPQRQQELWNQALAKYGSPAAARRWVAPPGRSQHNHGNAADLKFLNDAARQWVHANAGNYGLEFPLSNENWHIELAGARHGHRPAATAGAAPVTQAAAQPTQGATPPVAMSPLVSMIATGGMPQTPAEQPGIGGLALMFLQQQAEQRQQREAEARDEEARRAALFSGDSLAGLFG